MCVCVCLCVCVCVCVCAILEPVSRQSLEFVLYARLGRCVCVCLWVCLYVGVGGFMCVCGGVVCGWVWICFYVGVCEWLFVCVPKEMFKVSEACRSQQHFHKDFSGISERWVVVAVFKA